MARMGFLQRKRSLEAGRKGEGYWTQVETIENKIQINFKANGYGRNKREKDVL